jgi:hypothetical protein
LSVVRARFSSYREIEVMLGRAVHESSVSVDNMRILPDAPRHMRVTQATLVDESRLVLSLSQNHLPRAYQLIITDLQGVDSEPLGQLDLELVGEGSRVIFMSRAQGNGLLGSWGEPSMGLLAFLDDICQQEALAAGLVGTFTAWLSHGGTDMKCRVLGLQGSWVEPWGARCGEPSLTIDAGPWIGLDGFPIAHSFDELWGCRTLVPVRYHADGSLVMEPYSAWTGSDGQGREDGWCCADWTSTTDDGMVSNARAVCLGGAFVSDCINEARLVCGQVDPGGLADPVVDERFSKVVFVSSAVGTGDFSSWSQSGGETGLAAGDAICRNVAAAAGLGNPENFVVWASDSANDAYCRVLGFSGLKSNRCGQATLPTGGGPWTRPDGVLVAASVDDIVGGTLFSAPNLDETGTPTNNARVYTGSSSRGYGVASRCADWSDSSAGSTGAVGLAYVTYSFFSYFVDGNRCDSERPIYCFER